MEQMIKNGVKIELIKIILRKYLKDVELSGESGMSSYKLIDTLNEIVEVLELKLEEE